MRAKLACALVELGSCACLTLRCRLLAAVLTGALAGACGGAIQSDESDAAATGGAGGEGVDAATGGVSGFDTGSGGAPGADGLTPDEADATDSLDAWAACNAQYMAPSESLDYGCVAGRTHYSEYVGAPDVKNVVTGSNDTLVDACDASGNLIEATCEVVEDYVGVGRQSYIVWKETGAAVALPVDCGGHCVDGRCPKSCPQYGDVVRVESLADQRVRLRSCKDGLDYDCAMLGECAASLVQGAEFEIVALGGSTPDLLPCAGSLINIGPGQGGTKTCGLQDCRLELPIGDR